jgi:diguanylate cyclase (GGDEF)-like protein/PAS domain S-box-containing protein
MFNQELDKRVSAASEELSDKYNKIIEDKENRLGVMNQEYSLVKEEFQQVSAEKKQSESLVRSIADGLIVVNAEGEVQLMNPTAQKLLGADGKDAMAGKKLTENVGDDQLISMLSGNTGDKERDIELNSGSDDTKTVVRASSAVIEDEQGNPVGMVSILSDITARKESEEALRKSENRLRRIIEGNADGMLVVDQEGIVKFLNRAAEALFGRSGASFVGTPCGFPLVVGERREIDISNERKNRCIAEMHAVETEWEGQKAFLVSLRDVTETVELRERLRSLSVSDGLTGLYNRRGFVDLAEQQLKRADDTGRQLLLLYIDMDKMKWINDNLGHQEGDHALVEVADIMKASFKQADIIGRMGGDEFAVLVTEASSAEAIVADLQGRVASRNAAGGRNYQLSLSVGAMHYDPQAPCSIDELMSRADDAMYEEKRAKRAAR